MPTPKIKKKKSSLIAKFATIIGISVFYSVFFISAYNIYASAPIIKQYKIDKTNEFNSISKLIYERYKTTYIEQARFSDFRSLVNDFVDNQLVLHVGVVNNSTNEYVWSSISSLEGEKTDINNPWSNNNFKRSFLHITPTDVDFRRFSIDNNTMIIAFYLQSALLTLVEILIRGNFTLAITFVIFGFLSASILARQVTKPIEKLVIGVWEFSKGNLQYRTTIHTDDEIGILAKAFNYMAEKLDELYASMEKKVKERTLELSKKNEELNKANQEIKEAQSLLVHNEKMRSLGELVAGVAHELNNPINFIYGNMVHLKTYTQALIDIISKYEAIQKKHKNEDYKDIEKIKKENDYEFLKTDIIELIKSCSDGAERSKQIIIDLKNFSRLDQSLIKEIDINESLNSTLNILQNKYKEHVNFIKEYGEVPMFECYAGQMNQVFMNIIDNAAQAIKDTGDVYIRTKIENDNLVVEIQDTGEGIDNEIIGQIFDPFFTTKPVGAGSGLGLSITYKIVKSHNGIIEVESKKGKGTTFKVKIPLNWQDLSVVTKTDEPEEIEESEVS